MEEITLSVPNTFSETPAAPRQGATTPEATPDALQRLASGFLAAARSRDRLAITERGRRRRQENFELEVKRLVKNVASETAAAVPNRRGRAEVRARVYRAMMVLMRLAAQDRARGVRRTRRVVRWALATAAVGMAGILFAVIANGWLPSGLRH